MSLKDELNGLFNDRKMVTRAEQRAMENKVGWGWAERCFTVADGV